MKKKLQAIGIFLVLIDVSNNLITYNSRGTLLLTKNSDTFFTKRNPCLFNASFAHVPKIEQLTSRSDQ